MKRKLGIGAAAALFSVSMLANAGPTETELFVTISLPNDAVSAFRQSLDEPSRRAALEPCVETTNDLQRHELDPNFPRPLNANEESLFERLLFKCSSPGPEVFSAFGAASREAAVATAAPLDSIRVVLDNIASCVLPRCGSADGAYGRSAALGAAAVPCRTQRCYTGQVKYINDLNTCTCKQ
jgi:hypothetical protein